MRVFLTLFSLATVALAKPQYNYGNGVSGTIGSSHGGSTGGLGQFGGNFGSSGAVAPSFGGSSSGGVSSFGSGSIGGGGSTFGGNSFQQHNSGCCNQQSHQGFEAPLVHKQFITVAGPEDHDNQDRTKHLVIGRPQKNYRVVFIKAPSSNNANVKLSAEYAPKEEKTVIYVLSKKDSSLEINDIATPAPTVPTKPEVFFIKYKTDAEAQHAQRQIQAEYDKIEGSSEHTDAGVAPQQSVVGIFDNGNAAGGVGGGAGSFNGGSGSSGSSGFSGGSGSIGGGYNAAKQSAYLPPVTV